MLAQYSLPTVPSASLLERLHLPRTRPLRIAYSPDYGYMRVQHDVAARVHTAATTHLTALGHHVHVTDVVLPDMGLDWLLQMGAQQVRRAVSVCLRLCLSLYMYVCVCVCVCVSLCLCVCLCVRMRMHDWLARLARPGIYAHTWHLCAYITR
jgi:Asp-tRNA(Asn)/Glu-tRNA(Gln) amidotransferase A subunit family amidase